MKYYRTGLLAAAVIVISLMSALYDLTNGGPVRQLSVILLALGMFAGAFIGDLWQHKITAEIAAQGTSTNISAYIRLAVSLILFAVLVCILAVLTLESHPDFRL